jgi:hypothetical protein
MISLTYHLTLMTAHHLEQPMQVAGVPMLYHIMASLQ